MSASEWLRSRRPQPPQRLAERLEAAANPLPGDSAQSLSETLASAAAAILAPLSTPDEPEGSRSREVAIDLLAADALVTYAVEAATEECETFRQNVDDVIARLASLAPAGKI
jgi:hypothetical protein